MFIRTRADVFERSPLIWATVMVTSLRSTSCQRTLLKFTVLKCSPLAGVSMLYCGATITFTGTWITEACGLARRTGAGRAPGLDFAFAGTMDSCAGGRGIRTIPVVGSGFGNGVRLKRRAAPRASTPRFWYRFITSPCSPALTNTHQHIAGSVRLEWRFTGRVEE